MEEQKYYTIAYKNNQQKSKNMLKKSTNTLQGLILKIGSFIMLS